MSFPRAIEAKAASAQPACNSHMPNTKSTSGYIPVLCWHQVAPGFLPTVTRVTPARFERQLLALLKAGWRVVSHDEFLDRDGRREPTERVCLLSFDDAYAGVVEHAFPVLQRESLSALVFIPTALAGRSNEWDPGTPGTGWRHADWDQLRRLRDAGWEIGLHGASHIPLKGLQEKQLCFELTKAAEVLEQQLGESARFLAWPFGLQDREACRVAAAAGIRLAFGHDAKENPLALPRLMVYPWHCPAHIPIMLEQNRPGPLQKLAARGARLSALVMCMNSAARMRDPS